MLKFLWLLMFFVINKTTAVTHLPLSELYNSFTLNGSPYKARKEEFLKSDGQHIISPIGSRINAELNASLPSLSINVRTGENNINDLIRPRNSKFIARNKNNQMLELKNAFLSGKLLNIGAPSKRNMHHNISRIVSQEREASGQLFSRDFTYHRNRDELKNSVQDSQRLQSIYHRNRDELKNSVLDSQRLQSIYHRNRDELKNSVLDSQGLQSIYKAGGNNNETQNRRIISDNELRVPGIPLPIFGKSAETTDSDDHVLRSDILTIGNPLPSIDLLLGLQLE